MFPPVSHTTDLVAAMFDDEPFGAAAARAEAAPERPRRTLRQRLRRAPSHR
jgi:hypothetical protein